MTAFNIRVVENRLSQYEQELPTVTDPGRKFYLEAMIRVMKSMLDDLREQERREEGKA